MTIMLKLCVFFIIFTPVLLLRLKRDNCNDKLVIPEYCSQDQSKPSLITLMKKIYLNATHTTDCEYESAFYIWYLNGAVEMRGEEKNMLLVNHNPGAYKIDVVLEVERESGNKTLKHTCYVRTKEMGLEAVIEGGRSRTVLAGSSFRMDGSQSIDIDVTPNESGNLQYEWKCTVTKGSNKDFCEQTYSGSILQVPEEYALADHVYNFTLTITLTDEFGDSRNQSTNQVVTIKGQDSELKISCEENCPPRTLNTHTTILRVECLKICNQIREDSYEWTIENTAVDYNKDTSGRNSEIFSINENVLKSGQEYTIQVKLIKGGKGKTTFKIFTYAAVKIESCQVKPNQGIAIKTKFKVGCVFTGVAKSFEVYTVKDGKSTKQIFVVLTLILKIPAVHVAHSGNIEDLEFFLPINVQVFIRVKDAEDFSDVKQLSVNVQNAPPDEVPSMAQDVKDLVNENKIPEAVQVANGVIEEIEARPIPESQEIKKDMLKTFGDTPIESQEDARHIYSVVSRIVYDPKAESDPFQGELATKACVKGAEIDLANLQKRNNPKNLGKEIQTNADILMKCGETDTKPNLKQLEETKLDFNVTTPFPLVTLAVIAEDYKDYDANDVAASKVKKYEEASNNYVDICKTTLNMMALTTIENTIMTSTINVSAQITRSKGNKLFGRKIEISGAAFWVSRDFQGIQEDVDVMICSWTKNLFWWIGWTVATNVVLVRVSKKETEMRKFQEPIRVVLDIHKDRKQEIQIHEIENGEISVVRIEVRAGEAFFVQFQENFQMLLTEFEKPEAEEIKSRGKTVKDKEILYQGKVSDYDSWWYISTVSVSKYHLSVYTMSCYQWNSSDKVWKFSCPSSFNSSTDQIECMCSHLSILTGLVYNNLIRTENNITNPEFEMELISCPIIFICVATIFAIYSICLILVVRDRVKNMILYLPGDISSSFRFPYLVSIQTGRKPSSGTSSNICIRLFGEKDSSQSHVLNYPDPEKRMFQWGNQDWFLVPTVHFLGRLLEVALWSDHTGRTPSWYCISVTVYDLQTAQKWYFKFNTWFDLPPKGQIYIKMEVSEEKKHGKGVGVLKLWPRRTYQKEFSRIIKLTLLFSIFLTIFLTSFIMYGVPILDLNDGFAWFCDYGIYPETVFIGIGSAVVTFLAHMILVWFFRNKPKVKKYLWSILTGNVVVSMSILVILGFWVPPVNSWLWLTSVIISLLVYFFILENLYETFGPKPEQNVSYWIQNLPKLFQIIESQRLFLFKTFGEDVLRPYLAHLYQPMDTYDIKERKLQIFSRFKILSLLEDTIMFSCYITLLYLAIYANKNPQTVRNHHQMQYLMSGYTDITSIFGFYWYLNMTLAPTLHLQQWYSKYVVDEPGTMSDFCNKFLGVARLRQQRVVTYPCKLLPEIIQNTSCRKEFWYSKQSYESFSELSEFRTIWNYTEAEDAGITIFVGKFGIYHGGGFVSSLGRTLYNTYVNIKYMTENCWIDEATSVLFIEFLAYNVNTNLFNVVRIVTERSATGFFKNTIELSTVQLLFLRDEDSVVQIVIFGAFILIVVIFTVKVFTRIIQGKFYIVLTDLWIIVDLVIVAMSYGCFVSFLHRAGLVKEFLEKLEQVKKNQFINYFHLVYAELTFTLVAALLVFVSTIRLWKLCRFGTVFKIMEKTLASSAIIILSLFLSHISVILGFAFLGYMIFGTHADDFKDLATSLVALMRLSTKLVGNFNVRNLIEINPILGNIFFTSYMLTNLLFYCIYISIIILCYHEAERENSGTNEYDTLKNFVVKEFSFYKTSLKMGFLRLKGGKKKFRKMVIPKPDEFRYEDCLTMSSNILEFMKCVAWYNLKKYTLNEREKLKLMHRVVRTCKASQNEIFFTKKLQRRIKILHDDKVKKVAAAAELILNYDEKRREKLEEKFKKRLQKQKEFFDYVHKVLITVLRIISNIEIE